MKLKTEENFVLTNSTNERRFTIAASAKAFRVLSSSLYSRKIEAIVRELSCNAYDSHVMANKVDVPFRVHLPTDWEPEFWIEDFGVGLSKDDVETIYTSYFTSTKTESNDVIGALGLGSKTPFAYTDSFNLITRKDGKEYSYTAYINEAGEPSVSLLAESDTDQPNGVKVSVPVSSLDQMEFERCAKQVYKYFRTLPEFVGDDFKVSQIDFEALDERGYMLLPNSGKNCVYALMGNVCYEVTNISNTFKSLLSDISVSYIRNVSVLVKFEIGDLNVAASRETVSFDPQTEALFVNRVQHTCDVLIKDIQQDIDANVNHPEKAFKTVLETLGEWAFAVVDYKGIRLSKLKHKKPGEMLAKIVEDYFEPLYFPRPLCNYNYQTKKRELVISTMTKMPVLSNYELYSNDLYSMLYYFGARKSRLCCGEVSRSGYNFSSYSDNTKFYVFEGVEQSTFDITTKEFLVASIGFNNMKHAYRSHAGGAITLRKYPDDLKQKIKSFFGDMVEFVDLDKLVVDRKARKKAEAAQRKAAKLKQLGPVASKPKTARIKKDQVKVIESYTFENNQMFVNKDRQNIDIDDLKANTFILFTKERGHYFMQRPGLNFLGAFYESHIESFMTLSGVYRVVVIRDSDTKTLDRLKPLCVNPLAIYKAKTDEAQEHVTKGDQYTFVKNNIEFCARVWTYNYITGFSNWVEEFKKHPKIMQFLSSVTTSNKNAIELFEQLHAIDCEYRSVPYELKFGMDHIIQYMKGLKEAVEAQISHAFNADPLLKFLNEEGRLDLIENCLDKGYTI